MTVRPFDEVFRDFVIPNVPASGVFHPEKKDIRDSLNAVIAGPFPDNRVIKLNNANEGTPNEIIVSASVAIPAAAYQVLYILNVTQENTGPVTVSGAINRVLVTNTSRPIEPAYLKPGMALLCIDTGTELRLLSYGDAEAIQAAAEAAAERAEDAAEAAEAAVGGLLSNFDSRAAVQVANIPLLVTYVRTAGYSVVGDGGAALYKRVASEPSHSGKVQSADGAWWEEVQQEGTRNWYASRRVPLIQETIRTNGYHVAGDGGEALYKRVSSEPSKPGKFQTSDGAWWLLCSPRVNVKMFGAKGDGVANDTQAFKDAYQFFKTGTEEQGGTIHIPMGHYRLHDEWLFEGVDHVTNFWIEGDGPINTRLDFSSAPAGKNGIVLRGSSHLGIKKLFITGAKQHGIVLNDSFASFVSQVSLSELRIQGCGENGIYSRNSYLVSLEDVWATNNGGDGIGFYGNHTSIIGRRVYSSGNAGVGHRINGAVYVEYNGQSDNNSYYGYWLSNIRSATFNALGTEANGGTGIFIQTGVHTTDIFPEYQGFQGVVFNAAFNLRNATDGVSANSFVVETAGSVQARFTVIGCEEDLISGRASWTLNAAGGAIEISRIDTLLKSNIVTGGTPKVKNLDSLF